MDSTTLITFLFNAPSELRTVEVFGSWDNFSKGYPMQRDPHRGKQSWTGCHRFEGIVFDGLSSQRTTPRDGALKQGGRYWYYYKLNDQYECCNQAQPTSANCPLLPGQTVNVLDVPMEVVAPPQRVCSAGADTPTHFSPDMTTDPADRYKKIQRKPPTKLPRYYCSSDALCETKQAQAAAMESGGPVRSIHVRKLRCFSPSARSPKRSRGNQYPNGITSRQFDEPPSRVLDPLETRIKVLAQSVDFSDSDTRMQEEVLQTFGPLGGKSDLRPFGPMAGYSPDERPTTSHGNAAAPPIGLGISFDGFDDSMQTSYLQSSFEDYDALSFPAPPGAEPLSPLSPLSSPVLPSHGSHPNPLRANPTISISPRSDQHGHTAFIPETRSYFSETSDSEEEYHPGFEHQKVSDQDTGPSEMRSPTFTAATLSDTDGVMTPSRDLPNFASFDFDLPPLVQERDEEEEGQLENVEESEKLQSGSLRCVASSPEAFNLEPERVDSKAAHPEAAMLEAPIMPMSPLHNSAARPQQPQTFSRSQQHRTPDTDHDRGRRHFGNTKAFLKRATSIKSLRRHYREAPVDTTPIPPLPLLPQPQTHLQVGYLTPANPRSKAGLGDARGGDFADSVFGALELTTK